MWLTNFTQILDKHAPFKKKRIGKKEVTMDNPKQTWKLVNELSSRKTSNAATVKEIKLPDKEVTNASAIADAFNSHFTSIGERLASTIDSSNTDPTFYIKPTHTVFSFNRIETHNVQYRS
jgi:hypothetical protein